MKFVLATIAISLIALLACRVATAHFAPSLLRADLQAAEDVRWQQLVTLLRKTDPKATDDVIAKASIEISVVRTNVWIPCSFEAYSLVKIDETMYREEISSYWYTPWRIYKRRVLQQYEKVPPIWIGEFEQTQEKEPNQALLPTSMAVMPAAAHRSRQP